MWTQEAALQPPTERWQGPHAAESGPAAAVAQERRVRAWFGKSVVFEGGLTSSEDMTIDGRIHGTIEITEHHLTIGPDADIQASIVAKSVTVFGRVTGTITASHTVTLRETGSVEGDIFTPRLGIVDGALFRGRVAASAREVDRNT